MAEFPYILANNIASKAVITGQVNPDTLFRLSRLVNHNRYTRWQSTDTVLKNLDFDIPATYRRPVTCLVIDRNHSLDGVVCKFYWADVSSGPWTLVDTFTPSGTGPIFRRFSAGTHQYYRLELGNSAVVHRINQVWFGEGWSLTKNPLMPFDPEDERYDYTDFETESGVVSRAYRFSKRLVEMNFANVPQSMYDLVKVFKADIKIYGGFLWFVWRPDTAPEPLYMIQKMERIRWAMTQSYNRRDGVLAFEEVLG